MKYFKIEEFVDKSTYDKWGDKSIWFIDPTLLSLMVNLRELFGASITINDWLWGGEFQYRGLRPSGTPYHRQYSQHSFGRAVDFDVAGYTAEEARVKIKEWYSHGLLGTQDISLEEKVSWVHLDVRSHGQGILTFNP